MTTQETEPRARRRSPSCSAPSPPTSDGPSRASPTSSSWRCCAWSPRATSSSRTCPASARPAWPRPWPRSIDCDVRRASSSPPTCCPSDVVGVTVWNRAARRVRVPARARCSPTSCSATRSTGPPRRPSRRCSRPWPRARSPSTAPPTRSARRSWSSPPRTRSSTRAPTRCPRASSTASSCGSSVGYPDRDAELEVLDTHGDARRRSPTSARWPPPPTSNGLIAAARTVHARPRSKGYLVDLADATRRHPHLALGMSPRATLALLRVARARAAAAGPRLRHPRRRQGPRRARARPPPAWSPPRPSSRASARPTPLGEVLATVPVPTAAGQA